MYHSGEIRWFFEGRLPAGVADWFATGGLGVSEPGRSDDYLVLPACTTVGVKIRDGRFEVKALVRQPVPASYAGRASGMKDAWVKWSRNAGDEQALRELLVDAADTWTTVRKERHLRLFSLDGGRVEEVKPGGERYANGCQVELSSIGLGDADWWSLSFEAFGAPGDVLGNLDRVAAPFFEQPLPMEFNQQQSMSYPVWLSTRSE